MRPEAIANTVGIAERCNLELDFKTYHFPQLQAPTGRTLDEVPATEQSHEGLEARLDRDSRNPPGVHGRRCSRATGSGWRSSSTASSRWVSRLFPHRRGLHQLGQGHGIPVGPGRGSAPARLVAYALRITDLDPIPYNLLFERFLNPERISMPDIDVDFCQDRREEVIQYVTEKYGRDKVCQIITFGTMAAGAVIRDVGRALDIPYGEVDRIAKLVPEVLGITLEKAHEAGAEAEGDGGRRSAGQGAPGHALRLEGLDPPRLHPCGRGRGRSRAPLEEFCPVYKDQKSGSITTQYSMKYVEKIGLVKFDFLGLKNLTVIDNAVKLIRAGKEPTFDITHPADDDKASLRAPPVGQHHRRLPAGTAGMKELLVKLKPSCFEDIIALCRPLPSRPARIGMVDDFIDRKHGRKTVVYDLPQLEPILKDTYGVIVYQEQVMQIARALAGYSLGGADLLRRAMGKKDPAEMAKQQDRFLDGARRTGDRPRRRPRRSST